MNTIISKKSAPRKALTAAQFRNFMFAGRAVFTLENRETKNYITFKIKQLRKAGKLVPNQFSVQCKALGDTTFGYVFLGFMHTDIQEFRPNKRTSASHLGFKTFYWLLDHFNVLEDYSDRLDIYHEGACCKCGMPLTVPESIEDGIGPICKTGMLKGSIKMMQDLGTYDPKLTYEENVVIAVKKDASLWGKLHIPSTIQKAPENIGHRLFAKLKIW